LTLPHTLWPIFRDNRFLLNHHFKKPTYRQTNYAEYNQSLRERIDIWLSDDIIENWQTEQRAYDGTGSSPKYPDSTLMACHYLRLVFKQPLITQDIDLPGMEAKTITLNGQEIHLPAIEPVKMSVEEFDHSVTQGKGYASQYAGSEYLDVLAQAAQSDQEADDTFGLASEKIHYAAQNMNDLKLYNTEQRTMPELPERKPSGQPFIDGVKRKH